MLSQISRVFIIDIYLKRNSSVLVSGSNQRVLFPFWAGETLNRPCPDILAQILVPGSLSRLDIHLTFIVLLLAIAQQTNGPKSNYPVRISLEIDSLSRDSGLIRKF